MKDKTFELAERLADEAFGSKGVIEYSSRQELTSKFYEILKEPSIKFKAMKRILIGGQALVELGSSRATSDLDYLVDDKSTKEDFIVSEKIDLLNANGNNFFAEIYKIEKGNEIASPQSLLELKAYAFVQHCQNYNWQKVDDCEYDIKFVCRKFNLKSVKIVNKYITSGELSEVMKVINSVK